MANLTRNFIAGRMNKTVDERLVPNGEYINALNVRMGSTEASEVGVIENAKGNIPLTTLSYNGNALSSRARCIGAFDDGTNETLYWFVHDDLYPSSPTGKIDLVVSFSTTTNTLIYHLISVNAGFNVNTTLNFDPKFLITGVNKVEDLLYWTDDFNQPRQINVKRNYANPVAGVDGFFNEAILVIKQPPIASPTVVPTPTSSQDNFLEERFICFAYRYRYEDNEYSATSQWSKPAFLPNSFRYDFATALNSGMSGSANMAVVTYNSGGPLVKSIELLFKENQFPTIRIIEKFNKQTEGLADNTNYTFEFQNSQIFTILENSEILRLYDNVPLLAKAQTTMGNRLMYGNYVDGYDMVDLADSPVRLEYISNVISEEIGSSDLDNSTVVGNWTFGVPLQQNNGKASIDFAGVNLVSGGIFTLDLRYKFGIYGGDSPFPTDQQLGTNLTFTYILQQPFANVFELFQDADFQDKIGTALNIQTVANACTGTTFTDAFNCSVEQTLEVPGSPSVTLYKYESGQSAAGQPILTVASPASTFLTFQMPTMRYVDDPNFVTITQSVYTAYQIESADATYSEIGNPTSLHSNRGYEVGIVYMDEFNRSSTALVSNNNAVHIPCASSALQNKIQINIPTGQRAPSWAKRYKFCIKADKEIYETIYTTFFFRDTNSNDDWFLLDGQNSQKVQIGSELIVKTDTSGPRSSCTYTTVLDKVAQAADWLDPAPIDDAGQSIKVPGGTYMRLSANNFSTTTDINDGLPATWTQGEKITNTDTNGPCGIINYQINVPDPNNPGQFVDLPIPAGSKILIKYESIRIGRSQNLEGLTYIYEQNFTSAQDYSSFKEWWDGDNIGGTLNAAFVTRTATFNQSPPTATYDNTLDANDPICNLGVNFKFVLPASQPQATFLTVNGIQGYGGRRTETNNKMEIIIQRANSLVVFETEPIDAAPNIWLESSEAYNINTTTGEHLSPKQSQDFATNTPALILTDFFNCYSFGNGVESYKIEDAITGKQVELGNRAYTTTDTDFKRVRRYSDITYSGVYNEESNRNGLNEFNLGLLNFKSCEQSFGPINKLFARQRDILTLQEDKISYVQTDINLLSDAAGGSGVVVAIPKVLGSQVARAEEYGISNNPESFVQWGPDKYFTDAKRGSVINLKGQTAEALTAVSMMGMRSWFRDLFIDDFNTQKLGGFDPYMNEYVISSNSIQLPTPIICEDCGITTSIEVKEGTDYITCYELGDLVGDVVVDYTVSSVVGTFTVTSLYNGISTVVGPTSTSGTLTFTKDVVNIDTAQIFIDSTDSVSLQLTVNCPAADSITIVLVTITSDNEEGLFTTNQYRWQDGTFISPLHTEKVKFATGNNPIVSSYSTITGQQGGGVIPSNGATVAMFNNTIVPDDFVFDIAVDEFKYLRSSTTYNNTPTDIQALLATTNTATPILAPTNGNTAYYAQFQMPSTGDYLYLVWDYRNSTPFELCYDATTALAACCDCQTEGDTPAPSGYVIRDCMTGFDYVAEQAAFNFTFGDVVQYKVGTGGGTGITQCGTVQSSTTVSANASIQNASTYNCDNETDCPTCTSYTVSTYSSSGLSYSYTDCDGLEAGGSIGGAGGYDEESFCARKGTVSVSSAQINLIQFGPCAP